LFSTPEQSPLFRFLEFPLNPPQSRLEPGLFLKLEPAPADLRLVEQEILEELGFSLDLARLATGLGSHDASCGTRATPPEVDALEEMVRAVIAYADSE
jgi:hypothetical protein